jgi:hypothetical protein
LQQTVDGEISEASEQIEESTEDIKETLYGNGKNPKLSSSGDNDDTQAETNDRS